MKRQVVYLKLILPEPSSLAPEVIVEDSCVREFMREGYKIQRVTGSDMHDIMQELEPETTLVLGKSEKGETQIGFIGPDSNPYMTGAEEDDQYPCQEGGNTCCGEECQEEIEDTDETDCDNNSCCGGGCHDE